MSLADDRKFAEVLADMQASDDPLACVPERDRHVWLSSAEVDGGKRDDEGNVLLTAEEADTVVFTPIAPDARCRCGAKRYDDRETKH